MGISVPDKSEYSVISVLPSKFLPYDVDHFEIRSFSVEEVKYLVTENLSEEKLIEIYQDNIFNYDVKTMSWSDFLFICTHITLFTDPSHKWVWEVVCKECANQFKNILTSEFFFEFKDIEAPDLPIKVTIKGENLEFGVTTVQDHIDWMKGIDGIEAPLKSVYSMSFSIKNMKQPEAYAFLLNVRDKKDQRALAMIDKCLEHDTEPLKLKCKHCKKESLYSVDLEVSTLKPFRDDENYTDLGIEFG